MGCRLIGRWRIVAADIWERDYLDLCGPAMLDIRADGHGEITFGAFLASLDLPRLFGRLFRLGGVRRDGRGQRLRVGRTPRRRLLGDRIRAPS